MDEPGGQGPQDPARPLTSFQFAQLWAVTIWGISASYLFNQDCARHLKLGAVLSFFVAAGVFVAAGKKRSRPLWWAVLMFSLLKNATILQMAYYGKAPNPILQSGWLPEVFKSLFRCYFSLPQMLMLNLHGAPLFCLLLCNAGVSTVLYATVAGRSLLHAGLQACGIQAVCCYAFVCIKHSATRSASQVMKGGRLEGVPKVEQLQAEGAREEDGGTPQKAWQPQQQQQQAEKPVKEGQEVQPSWLQQQQQQWQQHEGPRHNKGQHSEPHSPPICDSAADLCRRPGCRAELAKGIAEALADVYTERDSNAGLRTLLHADSANLMEIGQPQQSDSTDKGRADAMERQQLQVEGSRLPLVEKGQLRQSIRTDKEKAAAAWERQQVPAKQKGDRLAPINLSSAELHTAFPMLGPASPRLHKMTLEALKARAATTSRRYSSLLDQPGRSPSSSTLNCVQKACRLAVKINGPSLPEHIPAEALQQLRSRMQRFQKLTHGETPAVRAGCLVISFGSSSLECVPGRPFHDALMHKMREETAAIAQEWAQEHGLMAHDEGLLFVQACQHAVWGSTPQEQPSAPKFSMALQTPFLMGSHPPQGVHASCQQQVQAGHDQELEALCHFELSIAAPEGFELRGWQGAADAPEELPDDVKSRSLCLLASMDGQFVRTSVEEHSRTSDGERVAQARVSLPVSLFEAGVACSKVLVLELWAAGSLVCSYSAVLLPSSFSGALAELQGMQQGTAGLGFIRDLAQWTHFQAYSRTAQQQQQQQQQEQGMPDLGAAEGTYEQELALMADVGRDLLAYSLACGMVEVAGLLLEGLMGDPFSLPASALLEDQLLGTDQQANGSMQQPDGSTSLPAHDGSMQQKEPPAAASALADTSPVLHPSFELGSGDEQAGAPSWAAAAYASIQGFGAVPGSSCQIGNRHHHHYQQRQQQRTLETQPSEAAFGEWCAAFTKPLLSVRYCCCVMWAASALVKAFMSEMGLHTRALIVGNSLPYLLFRQPKVSLQAGKWAHIICWIMMSATSFFPPECFTRNIVEMNIDGIVISLFLFQCFDKVNAKGLLCERILTTGVLAWAYNGLGTWCPVIRSLLVNAAAGLLELAFDAYFRYLYLKHMHSQRLQRQKKDS